MVTLVGLFVIAVAGAVGAYFGSYLREKGKNWATHEDVDRIVRTTEDIKAEISGDLWVKQRRWDAKWECYAELATNLGELHTLLSEAIAFGNAKMPTEEQDRINRAEEVIVTARRAGSKARLAVPAEVRTRLTTFGDEWNAARTPIEKGTASRNAWMDIIDMGRSDLYGEPREPRAS
jgi:hypothetical protein